MKFLFVVFRKNLKDFTNKRQVYLISSSLEVSIAFHSLVNMVESEDITLEKIKTKELSLDINTVSDSFNQTTSISDKLSETLQIEAVVPNYKSKSQFKEMLLLPNK